METISIYLKIARLVCKKRLFGLNEIEEEQLETWNRQLAPGKDLSSYPTDFSPETLKVRYAQTDIDQEWARFRQRTRRTRKIYPWTIAASICLLIIGGFIYWYSYNTATPIILAQEDQRNSIALILDNGQEISLSDSLVSTRLAPNTKLHPEKLEYQGESSPTKITYNTLIIPKGTYYHLILSDGTKVWLNADTRIHYPVQFGKLSREISLKGEAYFEVAKDTTRPFIVNTEGMKVKVLGTKFNVNSYQDDGRIYAILEEGSVEVSNGQDTQILQPRQIAYTNTWGNTSKLTVASCDPALFTGWKEGELRFRNTSLTQILKQISRCYDVTVILDHNYQEEYFSGDISYHTPLANLLQAIEASTSVRFKIEGHTVYMKKK